MVNTAGVQLAVIAQPPNSIEVGGITTGPDGEIWYFDAFGADLFRLDVNAGATARVVLTATANPTVSGQPSEIDAQVLPTDPDASVYPAGYVVFSVDGVPQAPLQVAPANLILDTSNLPPGGHTITASYYGDVDYLGADSSPLTLSVTPAQTATTTALSIDEPDPPVAYVGGLISLTATVSPAAAGTVQFYDGPFTLGAPVAVDGAGIAGYDTTALPAGIHTLSAVFTPSDPAFTGSTSPVRSLAIYELNFGVDRIVTAQGTSTVTTSPFSTTDPPGARLLVAFTSSDGPKARQSTTVSGGGLTWTLAERANTKGGTAEIWTAYSAGPLLQASITSTPKFPGYDQSLTVLAFTRASGVGAGATASRAGGAPTVSLTTTQPGSQVFAVGEDYNGAIGRTLGPGQNLVSQWVDTPPGETFWTQEGGISAQAGTPVTMNDTAPSGDTWNLAAIEVLPAP
jgi:Bacterial Ig-like domain (group 3)